MATNTDVTKMIFFAVTDPKLITVDFAAHEKRMAEHRKEREKANPPKPEPVRVEYNRLRQRFFDLQQQAKNAEVFCNNKADAVKGLEQRITELLKQKKQADADGHLGQERVCEHQIQLLETELVDAKDEFIKAKHWSTQAARALKAFTSDSSARIEELKQLLKFPAKLA